MTAPSQSAQETESEGQAIALCSELLLAVKDHCGPENAVCVASDFQTQIDRYFHASAARTSELEKRLATIEELLDKSAVVIEKMDTIHEDIMTNGPSCTCYDDPEGVCVRCNKSTRLSEAASKQINAVDNFLATASLESRLSACEAENKELVEALKDVSIHPSLTGKQVERNLTALRAHAARQKEGTQP